MYISGTSHNRHRRQLYTRSRDQLVYGALFMRQKRKRDRILVSHTRREMGVRRKGGEHVMAHTAGYAAKLVQPVFIFERRRADVSEEPDSERASDRASAPSPISGPLQHPSPAHRLISSAPICGAPHLLRCASLAPRSGVSGCLERCSRSLLLFPEFYSLSDFLYHFLLPFSRFPSSLTLFSQFRSCGSVPNLVKFHEFGNHLLIHETTLSSFY